MATMTYQHGGWKLKAQNTTKISAILKCNSCHSKELRFTRSNSNSRALAVTTSPRFDQVRREVPSMLRVADTTQTSHGSKSIRRQSNLNVVNFQTECWFYILWKGGADLTCSKSGRISREIARCLSDGWQLWHFPVNMGWREHTKCVLAWRSSFSYSLLKFPW